MAYKHHDEHVSQHEDGGHKHHSEHYGKHAAGHKKHAEHIKTMGAGAVEDHGDEEMPTHGRMD